MPSRSAARGRAGGGGTATSRTRKNGGGTTTTLLRSVMRPVGSLPIPDRLVGTKVGTSLAAERALETGDELEDVLRMGSEQFDGANVRQQLRPQRQRRSTAPSSKSQRFSNALTSMRFVSTLWNNTSNQGTSSRRATVTSPIHTPTLPTSPTSPTSPTTPTSPSARGNRRLSLEYNGGHAGAAGLSSTHHLPHLPPTPMHMPGVGHGELPTLSISRSDAMRQQAMLLSMRCEASRSTRRLRTHNHGQALIDWLKEEAAGKPMAVVKPITAKAGRVSRKILPWKNSKNATNNSTTTNNKLQRRNLQKFNLMEQESSPDNKIMVVRQLPNFSINDVGAEDSDDDEDAGGGGMMHDYLQDNNLSRNSVRMDSVNTTNTDNTKTKKKKKKKWRLWLPNRKEPIELIHPSDLDLEDDLDDYLTSNTTNTALPAHLKLKQQIALQKQRQSTAETASRHLELQLNDTSDNNLDKHSNSSRSTDIINNNSTSHSRFSLQNSSHHSHNYRSTRLDVHSNQPLLVRTSRIALDDTTMHADDSFGSDSDNIHHSPTTNKNSSRGSNSNNRHDHDQDTHHYSPINTRKISSTAYLPKHIQMKLPKSRGSMLVQQVSALSFFGADLDDDDDYDEVGGTSTRSAASSIARPPPTRISDASIGLPSSIRDTSVYGVDWGDDDDDDDDDQFYNIQELMDASNSSRQRRRTLGVNANANGNSSSNLPSSLQLSSSSASALDSSFSDQHGGFQSSLLQELWCSDSDMDNLDELHAEFHNLSTKAARSDDGNDSSRRMMQQPSTSSSPSFRRHANATGQSLLTSYRNKNKGLIRLECLQEEEDDDPKDANNQQHLQSQNDSDPKRGADPQFGGSTRRMFGSSITSSVGSSGSAQARSGSLASTHASHDSSCSFYNHQRFRDSMLSQQSDLTTETTTTTNNNNNNHHHQSFTRFSSSSRDSSASSGSSSVNNSHRINRRKTLPFGAMGSKQHGIRGGIIKDYAQEFLLETAAGAATTTADKKKSITTTDDETSRTQPSSSSSSSLSIEPTTPPQKNNKTFIPPAPLMATTDKPLPLNNRCSSLPERWRYSSSQSSSKRQEEEEEGANKEVRAIERTPPPPITSLAADAGPTVNNNSNNNNSTTSSDFCEGKGFGKSNGGDWWTIDKEIEQGIWKEICTQSPSYQKNTITIAEDNNNNNNSQGTHVYVVWDEDGDKDPYIYVGEEIPAEEGNDEEGSRITATTTGGRSLPLDVVHDSSHDYYDARSVCSEPAHMGMLIDDSFHTTATTAEEKKWLLAWDDLALL